MTNWQNGSRGKMTGDVKVYKENKSTEISFLLQTKAAEGDQVALRNMTMTESKNSL